MRTFSIGLVGSLFVLAGCEDVTSTDLFTSGMYAELSVVTTGDGVSLVTAILKSGGKASNTYVELAGDDVLSVTLEGDTRTLAKESTGNFHQYVTTFDAAPPSTPFVIQLARSLDGGAPESSLELPEPFTLTGPEGAVSRSASLTFTWTPSGQADPMEIVASGACILSYTRAISGDPGTVTLEANVLEAVNKDAAESCEVRFDITRWRAGSVDAGFGQGGEARGEQVRSVSLLSQP